MSNHLAIATVTATLSEMLDTAVKADVTGAGVSMIRPNLLDTAVSGAGVNIFLYQVQPNAALRNADLPTRRSEGSMVDRPTAALDLYYILTFYGEDTVLEPQRILASAVRALHAKPLLTRQAIRDTIGGSSFAYLAESNLADQPELVRFTPTPLNLEELSKLWSVFFQTAYRLSVAYTAKAVLIETDDRPGRPLPVIRRNVYVRSLKQPIIEKVTASDGDNAPITGQSTLIIEGKNLFGEVTRVRVGNAVYSPFRAGLSQSRISLDLSSLTPISGALRAGAEGAQVIHRLLMGTPEVEHEGVESDVRPLLLRPTLVSTGTGVYDYNVQISAVLTAPDGTPYRDVTVRLTPDVGKDQRVALFLNEYNAPDPASYSYSANPRTADGNAVVFSIPTDEISTGDYLIRVQVDGATSPLLQDLNEASPTCGRFIEPRVLWP